MLLLLVFTAAITLSGNTQVISKNKFEGFYRGIGLGLDYGGIGFKIEYLPVKQMGLFGGVGYNFDQLGVNGGISFKIFPNSMVSPFVMGMYGYNAVIILKIDNGGGVYSRETYYGPSAGAGLEFKTKGKGNKLCLAVIVPFRGTDFEDDYNSFQQSGFLFNKTKSPVLFSIGYNWSSGNWK